MATTFGAVNLVHKYAPRAVLSAAVLASTTLVYVPQVPQVQYKEGWRSQFSTPPKVKPRSVALLGNQCIWPYQVVPAQVQTPTALAYDLNWATPPAFRYKKVCVDNLTEYHQEHSELAAVTAEIGFHNQSQVYSPKGRDIALLQGYRFPQLEFVPPAGTAVVTEMWYQPWETPPDAPKPRLSGNVAWPGSGYLLTQVQTAANIEWWVRWGEPSAYSKAKPRLEGFTVWAAKVANVQFQDGWRSHYSLPARLDAQPRLEGYVAWPGVGFSFLQTATTTDLFQNKWQRQPIPKGRSPALRDSYSLDWTFHGGFTVTPAPVKSSIMFVLDNAITCAVEDVNFNIIVASSTINPDLDP